MKPIINIEEHRLFAKYRKKLSSKQKIIYRERIKLLQSNPRHPLLKMHRLHGILNGFYAFSLGGDLRVIFQWIGKNNIVLYRIGTHNQVY